MSSKLLLAGNLALVLLATFLTAALLLNVIPGTHDALLKPIKALERYAHIQPKASGYRTSQRIDARHVSVPSNS